jgi:hypothetical protein
MQDVKILASVMASRDAYSRVAKYVNPKEFSPGSQFWWTQISEYYDRDRQAKSVDTDTLRSIGSAKVSNPKHRDAILGVLTDLPDGISPANVVQAVLELKRQNKAAEFAQAAMGGEDSKAHKLLAEVNDLYTSETLGRTTKRYAVSVEELWGKVGSARRIPLSPQALSERTGGGVLPGEHILVFGRTEIGKSTFVINLAAGLIQQEQRVLYVGNEDDIDKIKSRFVSRICRATQDELESNKERAERVFRNRGGEDRLKLVHFDGEFEALREDIDDYQPTVVVVDQIRGIGGPEDNLTKRLEGNAIRFRSLISEYNLIGISVAQAGNRDQGHNEDGPLWLGAGDVDSSRVGLPAQADLMLGIGANNELLERGQRAISVCKNKLWSGPHARDGFIVQYDVSRSLVT